MVLVYATNHNTVGTVLLLGGDVVFIVSLVVYLLRP